MGSGHTGNPGQNVARAAEMALAKNGVTAVTHHQPMAGMAVRV